MKRLLAPSTNMAGLSAAAATIYAAVLMIYHVVNHQAAFSVPVAVAGVAAALALLTRQSVTPIADPLDGNGNPLITAPAPPATTATPTYPPAGRTTP